MESSTVLLVEADAQVAAAISALAAGGFRLVGLKLLRASATLAAQHYAPRVADREYRALVAALAGGRVSALAWEGEGVVEAARALVGASGSFMHASASAAAAQRELCLWFSPAELVRAPPSAAGAAAGAASSADAELNAAIAAASAGASSAGELEGSVEKVQKREKVAQLSDVVVDSNPYSRLMALKKASARRRSRARARAPADAPRERAGSARGWRAGNARALQPTVRACRRGRLGVCSARAS
jgi:nucleoside-diphosphate kinase